MNISVTLEELRLITHALGASEDEWIEEIIRVANAEDWAEEQICSRIIEDIRNLKYRLLDTYNKG